MDRPPPLPPAHTWAPLLEAALAEDLRSGDVTSELVIDASATGSGRIEARQPLVVCGLELAAAAFVHVDPGVHFDPLRRAGERAAPGEVLARMHGPLRGILAAERTALNFLGRMCGVATQTARYVDAVSGTGARILDTRKTLPGWRALDKHAVAAGGGENHRFALDDAVLLKDNHVHAAGGVGLAVKTALAGAPSHLQVQVEVESLEDARAAVEAGADALLLDNQTPEQVRQIVDALGDRVSLEASGGITLDNVRAFAEAGAQRISIGALTHSAPCADVALELEDDAAGGVRA
ncbi:MAG: carboxylating nicotinate-nucleotide diphosphorylase [Deltaproteobacteria bacterium]|nr:carboxylating nicotinate-nucleotide diphosphorylase [Deltaproteobacteria bacterium]MBW2373076.1 carboxylating nicotinate-nucleotide diphosphorylase [Deltaproteobacteria bacterium]